MSFLRRTVGGHGQYTQYTTGSGRWLKGFMHVSFPAMNCKDSRRRLQRFWATFPIVMTLMPCLGKLYVVDASEVTIFLQLQVKS